MDRGVSAGTTHEASTGTNGIPNTTNDDINNSNELELSEDHFDSILAESIIRIRTQLHRDESSRCASITLSQHSGDQLQSSCSNNKNRSNECDGSTVATSFRDSMNTVESTVTGQPPLSFATSAASSNVTEPANASPSEKERAIIGTSVASIPSELYDSMKLIDRKNAPSTKTFSVPERSNTTHDRPTVPPTLNRDSNSGSGELTDVNLRVENQTYDSQEFGSDYFVNRIPIEAFPVPEVSEPVHEAVQISMDNDDDDEYDSDHADHQQNGKPSSEGKKRLVKIVLLIFILTATTAAVTVGGVCGSGACRSSSTSPIAESPPAAHDDDDGDDYRATMIRSYIDSISSDSPTPSAHTNEFNERAIDWMIDIDPLNLTVENDTVRLRQRYSLLSLWFHTTVNGSAWQNSSGWLDEEDECSWYGVTCTEMDHGGESGVHNIVTSLIMSSNNMNGVIPTDISFLSYLKVLKFDFNTISGKIPDSIGQCTDLEHVELAFNIALTGTLPESVGSWTKLTHFDISYNDFTGTVPSSVGNWSNILYFVGSSNRFYTTFPTTFSMWSSIHTFDFNLNRLHGTLPAWIGNWRSMQSFTVSGNNFTGTVPTTVGTWTNLIQIHLNDNHFNGTIPDGLGDIRPLGIAHFEGNNFTGTIPQGFCTGNVTDLIANCSIDCECCTGCV